MPLVSFRSLPDDARLWVFASSDALSGERATTLLEAVDQWLARWQAHGEPLTCGRDFRDDRFLAIAVDQSTAGASGCSIDGMFRVLQGLQSSLGTQLVGGGRVFWRDDLGVHLTDGPTLSSRIAAGGIASSATVFDTSVATAGDWRRRFEIAAAESAFARRGGGAARTR